jgi:hypothetical protein
MRIVYQDQNTLLLKDSNLLGYFIGTIFAIFGLAMTIKPSMFVQSPPLLFSLLFLSIGVFVICVAKVTTANLDKAKDVLLLPKISPQKHAQEYLLSSVQQLELQQKYRTTVSRPGISYNPGLHFQYWVTSSLNPLGTTNISIGGIPVQHRAGTSQNIASFIGVPFVERPHSSRNPFAITSTIQLLRLTQNPINPHSPHSSRETTIFCLSSSQIVRQLRDLSPQLTPFYLPPRSLFSPVRTIFLQFFSTTW